MRQLLFTASIVASLTGAFAQTPQQDDAAMAKLLPLKASVHGVPLSGAREVEPLLKNRSGAERAAIFQAAMRPVRIGESFQMSVQLERPGGARQAVTSDPRMKYFADGCLITSPSGFVTITNDGARTCMPGHISDLWVMMIDAQKQPQAWNRYFFVIQ